MCLYCRVKIEEDDERFSVGHLEKGERRLIIKKVICSAVVLCVEN